MRLPGDVHGAAARSTTWIVGAAPGRTATAIAERHGARALRVGGTYVVARDRARSLAADLRRAGLLRQAEPDVVGHMSSAFDATPFGWGRGSIVAPTLVPPAPTAQIGVLDTYVDDTHPDLAGHVQHLPGPASGRDAPARHDGVLRGGRRVQRLRRHGHLPGRADRQLRRDRGAALLGLRRRHHGARRGARRRHRGQLRLHRALLRGVPRDRAGVRRGDDGRRRRRQRVRGRQPGQLPGRLAARPVRRRDETKGTSRRTSPARTRRSTSPRRARTSRSRSRAPSTPPTGRRTA